MMLTLYILLWDNMGRGATQSLLQYCSVLSSLLDHSLFPTPFYTPFLNTNTQNVVFTFPCFVLCPRMLTPGNFITLILCYLDSCWIWPAGCTSRGWRRRGTLGCNPLILTHIWLYLWKWLPSILLPHFCGPFPQLQSLLVSKDTVCSL